MTNLLLESLQNIPLAYLDPGSGSLIIQLLVGAAVGIFFTLRLWGRSILGFFGIGKKKSEVEEEFE